MEKVYPNQVDVNSGIVQPLKPFDMLSNPLHILLGGSKLSGNGLSLDPNKSMSKYEKIGVQKMIKQVRDMKESDKNIWEEAYFKIDQRLNIEKTKGEC